MMKRIMQPISALQRALELSGKQNSESRYEDAHVNAYTPATNERY